MRKIKLISAAVSAALLMSSFPFMVSADSDSNNVSLAMESSQKNYTLDEIKSGASAKVYVEMNGSFQNENITALGLKFNCSNWDVRPKNMKFTFPNQLATSKGNGQTSFFSLSTYSEWTESNPSYAMIPKNEINSSNPPAIQIMTNKLIGYFEKGSGSSIAEFDVPFPTDLPAGIYSINFTNIDIVAVDSNGKITSFTPSSATGITFTVGDASSEDLTISADSNAVDENGNSVNWYFADEAEFDKSNITVMSGDKDVTADADIKFDSTPEKKYNGKTFDYTVSYTATYGGKNATGTVDVKIGLRGDADCSHKVDARDAAAIAKDLAQLYGSKKTTLTKKNGEFALFLANVDEGAAKKETTWYGKRDINARDAATIAKYLSMKFANPNLRLVDIINK